jgi:hypothetical protein
MSFDEQDPRRSVDRLRRVNHHGARMAVRPAVFMGCADYSSALRLRNKYGTERTL